MSPSIQKKRAAVANAYPGWRWQDKVDAMSDSQVIAIYYELDQRGKISKKPPNKDNSIDIYHQYTIFEYLEGLNEKV